LQNPSCSTFLRQATRNGGFEVAAASYNSTVTGFTDVMGMLREVLCPKTYVEQLVDSHTSDAAIISEMPDTSWKSSDPAAYRHLGLAARGFIPPQRRGIADMDTLSSQESCSGFYGKLIREAYGWSVARVQDRTALQCWSQPHGLVVENYLASVQQGWIISAIAAASWTKPDGATSQVVFAGNYSGNASDGLPYIKVGDYVGNDFHGWLEVTNVSYSSPNTTVVCTGQWETTFTGHTGTSFQLWNRTRLYDYLDTLSVPRRKSLMYAPCPPTNAAYFHCFKEFVDRLSALSIAGTLVPVTLTTLINTQFPMVDNQNASLLEDSDIDQWNAVDPIPTSAYEYRFGMRFSNVAHFAIVDDAGTHYMHMDDG